MSIPENFFPIGATYAPLPKATEVDVAEWPGDIENMAKLGLNTFRLFICWDRVERIRGTRDYSMIDRAFDLAEQNGLKVIANVGGTFTNLQAIYPPRHLVYDRHCALLRPSPDASGELRSNRFKLCYDDPAYQEETASFIHEAVARYRNRPSLIAWSGWNEPRLAECFCSHTIALYREWLREKYHDLETLAKAWSTEFPVEFRCWNEVFPQPKANFEEGGYIPYLDWRKFLDWNRREKFNLVRKWIREVDPATPVISHLISPRYADIFGEEDILGTSIYTIHAQRKSYYGFSEYDFATRQHVFLLSEGRRKHRRDPYGFWVVETEAGPVSWVHDLVPRGYSARQMNARDMLFVAHGARAILRWLYRSRISDAQAGEFNLVGWDGRITDRAAEFGKLATFLNAHAAVFAHHEPDSSGVLILDYRSTSPDIEEAEGYRTRYEDALRNLYNALLHIGVRAEFCNVRQISEGILDSAKVLCAPFSPHVDPETAEKLRQFVEAGGMLLAESPFAIKNSSGIHYGATPGGMTELFGVQVFSLDKLPNYRCGILPAYDFKAEMTLCGGIAEECFPDGSPAVVTNSYGRGRTVLYGSQVSLAYQLEENFYPSDVPVLDYAEGELFRRELERRLETAGVRPEWEFCDAEPEERKYIQVIPRKLPDGRKLCFILNLSSSPKRFSLHIPEMEQATLLGKSADEESLELRNGRLTFRLNDWGWSVLVSQ